MKKQPIHICVQPATLYYAWQVDAMLQSFQDLGKVQLDRVHCIFAGYKDQYPNHLNKVIKKWQEQGVHFFNYPDDRLHKSYISSIRPWLLYKHWRALPELENEWIFYHDCDIALTKPLDWSTIIPKDKKQAPASDCRWYLGWDYIRQKQHSLMGVMTQIVGIDHKVLREKEAKETGGAQYLIFGINANLWESVYHSSEALYSRVSDMQHTIKANNPDWHELQIWCADMWALLWHLWLAGWSTPTPPQFNFTWGTGTTEQWYANAIFHNAGVTTATPDGPLLKSEHITTVPNAATPQPAAQWASHHYWHLIQKATAATHAHIPATITIT